MPSIVARLSSLNTSSDGLYSLIVLPSFVLYVNIPARVTMGLSLIQPSGLTLALISNTSNLVTGIKHLPILLHRANLLIHLMLQAIQALPNNDIDNLRLDDYHRFLLALQPN